MHLKKYGLGNVTLGIIGVILNIVQLYKLWSTKRRNPQQILIINMSTADLFIAFISFIYGAYGVYVDKGDDEKTSIFTICVGLICLCFFASLSTCWLITWNRVRAIIKPMQHRTYYNSRKLIRHILATWLFAIAAMTAVFVLNKYHGVFEGVRFLLPLSLAITLILLVTAYTIIIKAILKSKHEMAGMSENVTVSQNEVMNDRTRKMYIHSLFIILNFMVCSSPYMLYNVLHSPSEHEEWPGWMAAGTMGLICITILNPMCYLFLNLLLSSRKMVSGRGSTKQCGKEETGVRDEERKVNNNSPEREVSACKEDGRNSPDKESENENGGHIKCSI